jgi:hypothetical protein
MTSHPKQVWSVRPGWGGQDVAVGWQVTQPGGGSPEPMGARRRSPRREAPERAGESDTAQVVGSSARLAADIATLETARVPVGKSITAPRWCPDSLSQMATQASEQKIRWFPQV